LSGGVLAMTRGRTAIEQCDLAHQHALLRRPQRTVVEPTVHDPEMRPDRISSDIPALPIRTLPAIQVHNDWTLHNIIVAADGVDYIVDFNSMRARTCAGSTGWRARQGRREGQEGHWRTVISITGHWPFSTFLPSSFFFYLS
jgi:hypothetical protein